MAIKKNIIVYVGCLLLFITSGSDSISQKWNIKDYGAVGDSSTVNTEAIQQAIDASSNAGGGTEADADRKVENMPQAYPEYTHFGVLPAYGMMARHIDNLQVCGLSFHLESPDKRPPVKLQNITEYKIKELGLQIKR